MEKDIQNYSPTVMFRGTTCIIDNLTRLKLQGAINVRKQTEFRTVVSEVSFFVGNPVYCIMKKKGTVHTKNVSFQFFKIYPIWNIIYYLRRVSH